MKNAGEIVGRLLSDLGIEDTKNFAGFYRSWNEIVGKDFGSHSRVLDVRGKTLWVSVDHPVWLMKMQLSESRLLQSIRNQFPQLGIQSMNLVICDDKWTPPVNSFDSGTKVTQEPTKSDKQPGKEGDLDYILEKLKKSIEDRDSENKRH